MELKKPCTARSCEDKPHRYCSFCWGRGYVLTDFGKAVLELVRDHAKFNVLNQEHTLEMDGL